MIPSGFELRLDNNPYDQFIREVVSSYKSSHRVKIPGIILTDIQHVLGPSAEIIVAANSEDRGISAEKISQPSMRTRTRHSRSPSFNKTIDLITPLRTSKSRSGSVPKTLDLITRTIVVDD
jgi:hypothetical protein